MENISACIITFNPDINRLKENISSLRRFTFDILLVDNGSTNVDEINKLKEQYNLIIIYNKENLGIAKALNIGFKNSIEIFHSDWILTLDQDSVINNSMNKLKSYISNENGIICPQIFDLNSKKIIDKETGLINKCITSGALTNVESWKSVNGFDEIMFIDNVDFDFCYRLQKKGYKIYRVEDAILKHEIGKTTIRKFLFLNVVVKNHSAFRKYYISRNIIYFARKQSKSLLILKAYLQYLKMYFIILFYESEKNQKINAIKNGFKDGKKLLINKKWC